MSLDVIYFHDLKHKKVHPLEDGQFIGNGSECRHQFDDEAMLNIHCVVSLKNGNAFIETPHNTKATTLNGLKLVAGRRYLVRVGDEVKIGSHKFIVSNNPAFGVIDQQELDDENPPSFEHDDLTLGGLKLEQPESTGIEEGNLVRMKKIRRVIAELTETKRQLEIKMQELENLTLEEHELAHEQQELELFLGDYRDKSPAALKADIETKEGDITLIDHQIEQNRRVLGELEAKRDKLHQRIKLKKTILNKLNLLEDVASKKAHTSHAIEVLKNLSLQVKIDQVSDVIAKEKQRYKELHEENAVQANIKKTRRFG
jgi:pSer/pThr/pTyr-binding forkhead associated (FHA) protein